jgi:hypothetical protein
MWTSGLGIFEGFGTSLFILEFNLFIFFWTHAALIHMIPNIIKIILSVDFHRSHKQFAIIEIGCTIYKVSRRKCSAWMSVWIK